MAFPTCRSIIDINAITINLNCIFKYIKHIGYNSNYTTNINNVEIICLNKS